MHCVRPLSHHGEATARDFQSAPHNKQRGEVKKHTRRAANQKLPDAYFALVVIQASL